MEEYFNPHQEKKFSSPEEELVFLRNKVKEKEEMLKQVHERPHRDTVIREEVKKYSNIYPEDVLQKGYAHLDTHTKELVLELSPEPHDKKIEELFDVVYTQGIRNALSLVAHINNPHLEDDFHRFLIQYIKAGMPSEIRETEPLMKALRHTLYEVSFRAEKEEGKERPLKELISSMEQFYLGIISATTHNEKTDEVFSIEIANPEGDLETMFYISVPDAKKDLFEKQILSMFSKAKLRELKDDYNIFNYDGEVVGAVASLEAKPIFPIKTYDAFDTDPLNVLLNTFSKIDKDGEGVSFQIVFKGDKGDYLYSYKEALRHIEQGGNINREIDVRHNLAGLVAKNMKEFAFDTVKDFFKPTIKGVKSEDSVLKNKEKNTWAIEEIKNKIATPIVHVSLRIVASAGTTERAEHILRDVASSFSQFANTSGNKLVWHLIPEKQKNNFVRDFAYRQVSQTDMLPLSVRELTTLLHFPTTEVSSPHIKISKSATAPVPVGLSTQGTILGVNFDRNQHTNIFMMPEDRMRHMYVIGQTGTGKTTLLKNMIIQDIKNGEGVCFIDPHGSDVQDILASIPKERYDDVVYFDPGYTARPMGLNMLEYDPAFPEQKTFVVNEMLSIFNKLFDMKVAGGPMFEQYFRNGVLLVMDDPETGNTLLDVAKVLSSKEFRAMKLSRCKNPLVVQFWKEIAEKAGGESSLANMVPYITNKFDVFLSNDIMRPIVSQEKSSFNMRELMDNKKIFLVNLAKGRLGDINANLLGLILVGKILMAALSRVDSFGKEMAPFYLYIDEFQNITTDSISQILSEARKYKLSLTIAHQFIAQLEEKIKDSVFGNVGTISAFRVGADDAEYLEKQFEPVFKASDIMNLDNRNCYMKLLVAGKPVRPFSMETIPPRKGNLAIVPKLQELSYLMYGKDRGLIEEEIIEKYKKPAPVAPPAPSDLGVL